MKVYSESIIGYHLEYSNIKRQSEVTAAEEQKVKMLYWSGHFFSVLVATS